MVEKTVEVVNNEGDITLVVRPMFPFAVETYTVDQGRIVLVGEGSRITLKLDEEHIGLLSGADEITLSEFTMSGAEPQREMIVPRR